MIKKRTKPKYVSVRVGYSEMRDEFIGKPSLDVDRYERVEIKYKKKKPQWELFKSYINSLEDNTIFTRGDLFDGIYERKTSVAMRGYETTIDHYRLHACHVGFLEHIGTGRYKKIHDIPEKMKSIDMKKFAYNDEPWKDWFITKEEKLKDALETFK